MRILLVDIALPKKLFWAASGKKRARRKKKGSFDSGKRAAIPGKIFLKSTIL
jgi:hypothetical protein